VSEGAGGSASRARIARCAHCGQSTRLDPSNPWRPFCSERCKMVDLGAWFGERYSVPAEDSRDFDKDE
jgi:endogenous inhibitor of DNA gyrase (YacG/DUF329 family)